MSDETEGQNIIIQLRHEMLMSDLLQGLILQVFGDSALTQEARAGICRG
jgi:hypothetical protein